MADVTLIYKGATIGELSESGNKTIKTAGKYCEADILLEYEKSGGGMKLLHQSEPTTEPVTAIKVNFPSSALGYDFYRIVLLGTFTGASNPYVGINTETNNAYLNSFPTQPTNSRFEGYLVKIGNSYYSMLGSRPAAINGDLSYIHTRAYNANTVFNVGFVIQIWGCNLENS